MFFSSRGRQTRFVSVTGVERGREGGGRRERGWREERERGRRGERERGRREERERVEIGRAQRLHAIFLILFVLHFLKENKTHHECTF